MKLRFYIILSLIGYTLFSTGIFAQDNDRLVRFKAVFVYNFIDFIKWPKADPEAPLKIGLIGNSPLEEPLREIAQKRKVKGRTIQVDVYAINDPFEQSHIVFITPAHISNLDTILTRIQNKHVLTIADTPEIAKQGVAINFVLVNDKLRFEINQNVLKEAGLKASAQLLKLAILVDKSH